MTTIFARSSTGLEKIAQKTMLVNKKRHYTFCYTLVYGLFPASTLYYTTLRYTTALGSRPSASSRFHWSRSEPSLALSCSSPAAASFLPCSEAFPPIPSSRPAFCRSPSPAARACSRAIRRFSFYLCRRLPCSPPPASAVDVLCTYLQSLALASACPITLRPVAPAARPALSSSLSPESAPAPAILRSVSQEHFSSLLPAAAPVRPISLQWLRSSVLASSCSCNRAAPAFPKAPQWLRVLVQYSLGSLPSASSILVSPIEVPSGPCYSLSPACAHPLHTPLRLAVVFVQLSAVPALAGAFFPARQELAATLQQMHQSSIHSTASALTFASCLLPLRS